MNITEAEQARRRGDKVVSWDGTLGLIKQEDWNNDGFYWIKWEQLRDWQYDYRNVEAAPNHWTCEAASDLQLYYKEVAQ